MKLKTVRLVSGILWVAAVLFTLMMASTENIVFLCIASAAVIAEVILRLRYWKCPHCGRYLGKAMWPQYCKYCGKKIDMEDQYSKKE